MARIDSQNDLICRIDDSCFRVKGELIGEVTNRILKVGDKFIPSDLKEMCPRFGIEWNFVSSRNGKKYLATMLVVKYPLLVLVS